jgi:2-oxoisovalerate dehydrogenase E1 component
MATEIRTDRYRGLDSASLIAAYRTSYLSRRFDDKEIQLKRQNKIYFQINSVGHEAVSTAAGMVLRRVTTGSSCTTGTGPWSSSSASPLTRCSSSPVGARDDPASAGRQMPAHWGHKRLNLMSKSSCTGMQFLHGVGAAEAGDPQVAHRRARRQGAVRARRGRLRLGRRGADLRGRVLGGALDVLHPEGARPLT